MVRKKKVKTEERTCDNCGNGPEGRSDDCDECEETEMVEKHLEDQGVKPKVIDRRFIGKHILEEFRRTGTITIPGAAK